MTPERKAAIVNHIAHGFGEAPDKITLECVACQRKVTVTYSSAAEIAKLCESVRCTDCKKAVAA